MPNKTYVNIDIIKFMMHTFRFPVTFLPAALLFFRI